MMVPLLHLELEALPDLLAVCRLAPELPVPAWAFQGAFSSISRTREELSVVCDIANVPEDVKAERGWRGIKVKGPLDFAWTGILAALATPLAVARISIFAISTFDTDYILVKERDFSAATTVLVEAGHRLGGMPNNRRT